MKDEIQYRVDCWVKDTNGRRDFLHVLNLELRKWEIKTKTDFKTLSEQKGMNDECSIRIILIVLSLFTTCLLVVVYI